MTIKTKLFGEISVSEDKTLFFQDGIIGFPEMKHFLLIHDAERENASISWLQSIEEPAFAMPVMDPLKLLSDYNPVVEDEQLAQLEALSPDSMLVLVTITVPREITGMTANFKAPIIINAGNNRACQLIIEDERYQVKHPVYELLKKKEETSC